MDSSLEAAHMIGFETLIDTLECLPRMIVTYRQ